MPVLENRRPNEASIADARSRLQGAWSIRLDHIQADPAQPRKTHDEIAHRQLVDSIRSIGLLQPITVRFLEGGQRYQIIAGERRLRAVRELGWAEVACWVQSPEANQVLLQQIAENWQRADLHPFDLADSLAALRDARQCTQKELAKLVQKPESEISKLLALLKLNPLAQRLAREDSSGLLSRQHLLAIQKLPSEQQPGAISSVRDAGLSAADTEHFVERTLERDTVKRGAPTGFRRRYKTNDAVVIVSFRKARPSVGEIQNALDEARELASGDSTNE